MTKKTLDRQLTTDLPANPAVTGAIGPGRKIGHLQVGQLVWNPKKTAT